MSESDARDVDGTGSSGGDTPDGREWGPTTARWATGGALRKCRQIVDRIDDRAATLRADATVRRVGLGVGLVLGLALAWLHWLGLVAGGAFVGLSRQSVPRAVLAGLGFGVVTLITTVLTPGATGVGAITALAPLSYGAVAIGLGLPAWGALVRGVV